ncbi:MAG: enoyl-CoA hydratase/isomerase family protein [Thermoanaerobaculia bacterium]
MSFVRVERRDEVSVVTLDRPRANAFNRELVGALSAAFTASAGAGAVVLASSSAGMFSAGWDLPALIELDRAAFGQFVSAYCDLVRQVFAFERPVVAAIGGHAIAGGLILAAAADERLAAQGKGELGLSEVLLGVCVPACLLEIFRHAVGPRQMERLAATGENLSVERALSIGLLDRIVPAESLLEEAVARARGLAGRPSEAHVAIKRRCRAAALARFDQARGGDPFLDFWFSEDAQDRIRALVAKLTKKG